MSAHPPLEDVRIGVIGLGYVGLPLAAAFGRHYPTVGFDINSRRISELTAGVDRTGEVSADELAAAAHLQVSASAADLRACNVFIVTVPTPVDAHKQPDLSPLLSASRTVAAALKRGDMVVYESTVYPGATEEVCVPVLESVSGLALNRDFAVGYSPERINPGDKTHRLTDILKVTSGSTPESAERIDRLYRSIIHAGTFRAASIKVAEAAKIIENTQRDVNIALINELALIFNRLGIDTAHVLEAAATKWNFLNFRPGLVGGHCIGVDPYYLTHKAQAIGYHPEVILAGRRINDGMGAYIAEQVVKLMTRKRVQVVDARILVLGFTFKENCPDVRNSRVIDIVHELERYHAAVDVHDPWADADDVAHEYRIQLCSEPGAGRYDAVIVAVAHAQFCELDEARLRAMLRGPGVIYDVKSILPEGLADGRL